jgi:hypothetical protein
MLYKSGFQRFFDLSVQRGLSIWIALRFLHDELCALAAEQVGDQDAMFAKDKCIERQRSLAFVVKRRDLLAASGAAIAVVKPTRLYRISELHLRLTKQLIQHLANFGVHLFHNDTTS